MRHPKLNDQIVKELLEAGHTVSEIAEQLGVTKGAVSKSVKRIQRACANKDLVLTAARNFVDRKMDAMQQLHSIDRAVNRELASIQEGLKDAEGVNRVALQNAQLSHCAEVRKQVSLLVDIAKTLYDVQEVRKFQEVVLEEIGAADPETRGRIVRRLVERKALIAAVGGEMDGLSG